MLEIIVTTVIVTLVLTFMYTFRSSIRGLARSAERQVDLLNKEVYVSTMKREAKLRISDKEITSVVKLRKQLEDLDL